MQDSSFTYTGHQDVTIVQPGPGPNGFWYHRIGNMPMVVMNKRGKAVCWVGGRLPVNGPALWFAVGACAAAGALGARIGAR